MAAEGIDPGDHEAIGRRGVELVLEGVRATLERFGVGFDSWFSERDLYASGEVEAALEQLERRGHTYRSEGALWLRSTEFGDDKDRVLIRADGEPTYLAADVAYHRDKLERGFERLIDVLGADHHGYAPRLRAAIAALGADPEALEALIMRLVHIVESGERAQMSKRSGDFVSLDELVDDIGVDAARWFMLWRSHDTTVDLDLELARRESSDNPVYYVQYAHARIASILRKAGGEAGEAGRADAGHAAGSRPSATWSSACSSSPRRCARRRRAAPRTGSAPTRPRSRPTSTPSTATARWSARRVRGSSARGSGSACWRSARSPPRSACSASPPPSRCEGPGGEVLAEIPARAAGRAAPGLAAARRPRGLRGAAGRSCWGPAACWRPGKARAVARSVAAGWPRPRPRAGRGWRCSSATSPSRGSPARSASRRRPACTSTCAARRAARRCSSRSSSPAPAPPRRREPLVCVVAGRPSCDGPRLLASERFAARARGLREAYELVVVDGPPLRDENSLRALLPLADATIACVGPGESRRLPVSADGLVIQH